MTDILRLIDLRVFSYGGISKDKKVEIEGSEVEPTLSIDAIDPEQGVVIIFPDGQRLTELEGDQGIGKTSIIECLKEATGGIAPPNAINTKDQDKKFSLTFKGIDGEMYQVKSTKTTYDLWHIMTDEDGKPLMDGARVRKQKENSPKSLLQKIVGRAGISPMRLKEMAGKEQIEWLKSIYNPSSDLVNFEKDLAGKIKEAYESRTAVNRDYKRLKDQIESDGFYVNQETHRKYFDENRNTHLNVNQEIKVIQQKRDLYTKAENRLVVLEQTIHLADNDIKEAEEKIRILQDKIEDKRKLRAETEITVESAKKYLSENEYILKEYEESTNKINEANQFFAAEATFKAVMEKASQKDHYENESIRLTNRLDELEKAKKEYIKSFAPEFEGFEVFVPDESEKKEGLYYHGKPLNYLAESELWEWATQLWEKLNVKIIFVENIADLGSGAVDIFNKFIEQGGYIFASKMNRKQKKLRINFNTKIPE